MLKCRPSIPQFIRELKVKTLKSYSPVYWVSTLTGYQCKNTKSNYNLTIDHIFVYFWFCDLFEFN